VEANSFLIRQRIYYYINKGVSDEGSRFIYSYSLLQAKMLVL
jgi:hypothetical protein